MFSLLCLATYVDEGFHTVTLDFYNSEVQINPNFDNSSVYFTFKLSDSYLYTPTLQFTYPNKSSVTKYFYSSTGISFFYPHVLITNKNLNESITFNIYILKNQACNASFITTGNMELIFSDSVQQTVCVFPHSPPVKVELKSSSSSHNSMYTILSPNQIDYSDEVTSFSGPAILVSQISPAYNSTLKIYDSTDILMKKSCLESDFYILNQYGFINQAFSGHQIYNCIYDKPSNWPFIVFFTALGIIVTLIIVCCFVCCCCCRPKPNYISSFQTQPSLEQYSYQQYSQPPAQQYSEVPTQPYGQPLLQNQPNNYQQYTQPTSDPYSGVPTQPYNQQNYQNPPNNYPQYADQQVPVQDQLQNPYSAVNSVY
ncbi:hypothetical protein TVAG_483730 [Trichomonas vaginalis G3]|uniref:Transmembrane protein n=1 Tax=Trichomonas vaginalis (strain ATCC PRA-98 / G3) TaxID=412133 RepID=A2EA17_TRIV3|nr:hypothetical protein TVAGG3_0981130 [Trichomonas vaginalis G3]EAY10463.1 hypothetical protein TVAG_483730 [Trichomonas vaginalis G3]KAI5489309.1 hypothetical protein TVAGG3_0981130 [Trichomonas vaginalis G3]|eukprot:XP_001322686.1 hypothetical protein [Trichomonas vaginalis G3]